MTKNEAKDFLDQYLYGRSEIKIICPICANSNGANEILIGNIWMSREILVGRFQGA
jgi:hypothetical protein